MPAELASLSPDELNELNRALAAAADAGERSRLIQQLRLESPRKAAQLVKLMEWREPPSDFLKDPLRPREKSARHERTLRTDQLIGNRYRIERLIGSGGMGDVYRALDTVEDKHVALKTLRAELVSDSTMLARFRREFRLTLRIEHPNVCRVLELGTPEGGEEHGPAFLTMELLDGPSLSAHLKKNGRLSPEAAFPIMRQLLMGVGAAHREGIVHRDLKPANVHLCTGAQDEVRVVVTDFGLARFAAPTESAATSLTATGNMIGTLSYMAPEVLAGKDASFAADIYAIGVMMYEMMTGRRPFEGDSPFVPALKCLTEDAPDPRLIVPHLEPRWVAAIQGCLEREPGRRFPDVESVLQVLEAEDGSAVTLPFIKPMVVETPAAKHVGRRKLFAGAGVIALCAGAFLLSPFGKSVRTRTGGGSTLADYRQAESLLVRYDKPGNLERAAALFEKAIAGDARNALAHAGLAQVCLHRFAQSRDAKLLELASRESMKALELNSNLAAVHVVAGRIERIRGNTEAALQELQRALELDSRSADARAALADVYGKQGRKKEAEESYRAAVDLEPNDWRWHNSLGLFYRGMGKPDQAIVEFLASVRQTPDNSFVLNNLAGAYLAGNKGAEAIEAYRKAIGADGTNHAAYSNLGRALFLNGDYPEAAKNFQQAVDLNPSMYLSWGNLAGAYQWIPDKDKAVQAYKKASELAERELVRTPKDTDLLASLAMYKAYLGERDASGRLIRQAVALAPENPTVLQNAGETYELLGMRDEALKFLGRALKAGLQIQLLDQSPDLAELRQDPRYKNLKRSR